MNELLMETEKMCQKEIDSMPIMQGDWEKNIVVEKGELDEA
jgi:hypothetical protein